MTQRQKLNQIAMNWDVEEKLGDDFASLFSNSELVDIYSDFINHFNAATKCVKKEIIKNIAFANFLKEKEATNEDRLSLFDLMIQIVQRFPRYILLLQDLLKETSEDHVDRASLKHALTTLEFVCNLVNERKREYEQNSSDKDREYLGVLILESATSTLSSAYQISTSLPSYLKENAPFSLSNNRLR